MAERECKIRRSTQEFFLSHILQSRLGLETAGDLLRIDGNRAVITRPLLRYEDLYLADPLLVAQKDDKGRVGRLWDKLSTSVDYVTNPATPWRSTEDGIKDSAIEIFIAGRELARPNEGLEILLPPVIAFEPTVTYPGTIRTPLGELTFNVWVPCIKGVGNSSVDRFKLIMTTSSGNHPLDIRFSPDEVVI